MVLKAIPTRRILQNIIFPDPNHPNLHRKACDYTYAHIRTYNGYYRYVHGMQALTPESVIDTYCNLCIVRLSTKWSYKYHLNAVHKIELETGSIKTAKYSTSRR